jgi:hypothetical protein
LTVGLPHRLGKSLFALHCLLLSTHHEMMASNQKDLEALVVFYIL